VQERVLHRVLGELRVAEDPACKPVRGSPVAKVKLRERERLRPAGKED